MAEDANIQSIFLGPPDTPVEPLKLSLPSAGTDTKLDLEIVNHMKAAKASGVWWAGPLANLVTILHAAYVLFNDPSAGEELGQLHCQCTV